jgi:GAF domain-containing protein
VQKAILRLLAPPLTAEDEEQARSAAFIRVIGSSALLVVIPLLILRIVQGRDPHLAEVNGALLAIVLTVGLILYLNRIGYVKVASILLVAVAWLGLSYMTWIADGIRDAAYLGYSIPILMAGLFLGWQAAVVFTILSILWGWVLAISATNGQLSPTLDTPLHFARDATAIFVLVGVLLYLMITSLRSALDKARSATKDLTLSNQELRKLRGELETRVGERTYQLEKRASQLEAVSSLARTIASVQDIEVLLPAITKLISQQFGFSHVGIFLLDERGERAVLRASNSEGGPRPIKQQHSLPLDAESVVGTSIVRGEARIAVGAEADSLYFDNPGLPETRAEVAVPLRLAGRVIGSLDVHSSDAGAFSDEDLRVLATLSDQAAIAIENARLFGEARDALRESRALFQKYSQQEWRKFAQQTRQTGYVFDGTQVVPLDKNLRAETIDEVIHSGQLRLKKASASIVIPIKLRDQSIGVLEVRSQKGERDWTDDEIALLEAAAERAALALENARLIENAQRRAARERAIGDIATKIGAVSNVKSILQTAVEELGRKIGAATEVTLEFSRDAEMSNDQ